MKLVEFEMLKREFMDADVDKKIDMYISTEGLTREQYTELLRLFPIRELDKLEAAMA